MKCKECGATIYGAYNGNVVECPKCKREYTAYSPHYKGAATYLIPTSLRFCSHCKTDSIKRVGEPKDLKAHCAKCNLDYLTIPHPLVKWMQCPVVPPSPDVAATVQRLLAE